MVSDQSPAPPSLPPSGCTPEPLLLWQGWTKCTSPGRQRGWGVSDCSGVNRKSCAFHHLLPQPAWEAGSGPLAAGRISFVSAGLSLRAPDSGSRRLPRGRRQALAQRAGFWQNLHSGPLGPARPWSWMNATLPQPCPHARRTFLPRKISWLLPSMTLNLGTESSRKEAPAGGVSRRDHHNG